MLNIHSFGWKPLRDG